jgi:predicted nicotinamide N-methyase
MNSAPVALADLFADQDEEADAENPEPNGQFQQEYALQKIEICGKDFQIRQFSWHQANANQVWPGTFRLAEFILEHKDKYSNSKLLELGAATGALSIFLKSNVADGFDVLTCDIDDGGEVEQNIQFNFQLNAISPSLHIPFTWGNDWKGKLEAVVSEKQISPLSFDFKFIIASDILLYISAYPALVKTLSDLFQAHPVQEFLMSWNRRIAESKIFFDMMTDAGFLCHHHGHCIYSFTR